jgi:hypothetical protein
MDAAAGGEAVGVEFAEEEESALGRNGVLVSDWSAELDSAASRVDGMPLGCPPAVTPLHAARKNPIMIKLPIPRDIRFMRCVFPELPGLIR